MVPGGGELSMCLHISNDQRPYTVAVFLAKLLAKHGHWSDQGSIRSSLDGLVMGPVGSN